MKIYAGKQKVGKFQSHDLILDFDDLTRYGGNLWGIQRTEQLAAKVLSALGWLLVSASLLLLVLMGQVGRVNLVLADNIYGLMLWLGLGLLIYSKFLTRDRQEFAFNLESSSLHILQQQLAAGKRPEIEIDNYLSFQLWQLLDMLCQQHQQDFLQQLTHHLWQSKTVLDLLNRLGLSASKIGKDLSEALADTDGRFEANYPGLFPALFMQALALEQDYIDERTVALVLVKTAWRELLTKHNVQSQQVEALELWLRNQSKQRSYQKMWKKLALLKPRGPVNRAYTSRFAPTLEQFGEDFTALAAGGEFELSLGKEQQMADVLRILQKDSGAAALLIGEPGVGKTRFLKHLATRMTVEDVPPRLKDKRLVVFNVNRAFTQSQSLESFKLVLQQMLEEVAQARNIILVLEDFDQSLNIRADLQSEVINQFVQHIGKYNLQLLGTSTTEGYNRFIKPIRALSSLLQPVYLPEPNLLVTEQILFDELPRLEKEFSITIQVDALKLLVSLSPKFAYERVLPDKAIDLLEECLLAARDQGAHFLTTDLVSRVISQKVGVDVGSLSATEAQSLLKLEEQMHTRVVGQDAAITAVAAALRRSRAGLKQGRGPVASFLFFGPTGVGKTEVARTLAAVYFGDQKLLTRLDMSEYQEEQNLQRLIGYNEGTQFIGGYLTEAIRQKPFSLLLLDEIEKANPKVLDLFLQVLDEGHITDGAGRKVDFSNTIIIATSNAGSQQIAELIEQGLKYNEVQAQVLPILRQVFRIEFLNRFDQVIMFKPLLPIEVEEVTRRMLNVLTTDLASKGMRLEFSDQFIADLAKIGYNPIYGAREIKRVIQEKVEDVVAEKIVRGELVSGGTTKF